MIFKVLINIPTKKKSNYLCFLSHDYGIFFWQSLDTNISSLELLVTEITAVLLVYPLRLSVIFLLHMKFSSKFEQQERQFIYTSYYIIIEYCHSNHLIPISVL